MTMPTEDSIGFDSGRVQALIQELGRLSKKMNADLNEFEREANSRVKNQSGETWTQYSRYQEEWDKRILSIDENIKGLTPLVDDIAQEIKRRDQQGLG
ncbi:hypothetical protein [Actinoplanes sp. NPDC051859]|uniref:hypothetical protein n=1 Tax=Actinoplanes sp. NPDC051859 TaxID=3363909 RepID=UPI0037923F0F